MALARFVVQLAVMPVATQENHAVDAMFFDVCDQALQLVLCLPPMPLAAGAAGDDLRAVGDDLDRRGRALEAV